MESIESKKFNKQLHKALLRIFYERLADPIFKRVTVNYLKVNRTKTFATVYLDLGSSSNPKKVLLKLNSLNNFFRRSLSEILNRYRVPFLKFVDDEAFKKAQKVEGLINEATEGLDA